MTDLGTPHTSAPHTPAPEALCDNDLGPWLDGARKSREGGPGIGAMRREGRRGMIEALGYHEAVHKHQVPKQ